MQQNAELQNVQCYKKSTFYVKKDSNVRFVFKKIRNFSVKVSFQESLAAARSSNTFHLHNLRNLKKNMSKDKKKISRKRKIKTLQKKKEMFLIFNLDSLDIRNY